MKLEVGTYVRTEKGIFQITNDKTFIENKMEYIGVNGRYTCIDVNTIIKASYNIIDLIEVGDYVNGSRVMKINCKLEYIDDDSDTGVNQVYDGIETEETWIYFEHEIKSIVTKEQFESMSYRIEDEK